MMEIKINNQVKGENYGRESCFKKAVGCFGI
jgi:hypothetical protein